MTLLNDTDVDIETDTTAQQTGDRRPGRGRRSSGDRNPRATRSAAAQRAIDRRAKRREREARTARVTERSAGRASGRTRTASSLRARITSVPFVVPVIGLLVVGLGLSLWLSTKAAADSYRLGEERQQNQSLLDKRDSLKRTYESGDSAPELSDKASRLGMIPARNPARMIVDGRGEPRVIGDPEPAQGKALRSINPPTEPDPVATIDPKKVDDSQGLPGTAVESDDTAGSADDETSSASPSSDQSQSDSPEGADAGETSPTVPDAGPDTPSNPRVVAPAPNVLPPNGNAPSANSAESR